MTRLKPVDPAKFTEAELCAYEEVRAVRHNPRGPTAIWSRIPTFARAAVPVGNYLRFGSTLRGDLRELAILVAAREHDQANEWDSHRPLGEREGLAPELLDAIAARQRPAFADDEQRLIHEATRQLCTTTDLDDATYTQLEALLGERGVVELITTVGFYTMLAMLLNATRAELPEGVVSAFDVASEQPD